MTARLVAAVLAICAGLGAHRGGLDSQGGHNDRKNGGYHFHRGPLQGKSYSSKAAGAKALAGRSSGSSAATDTAARTKAAPGSATGTSAKDGFACGTKRTCGQMASCAEARFYLNQCGLSRLDGDNDGTPCESLCR